MDISFNSPFYLYLLQLFNFCWVITYVLIIRRSYIDKVYAVPLIAVVANTIWDMVGFSIIEVPFGQKYINGFYIVIEIILISQIILYWRADNMGMTKGQFFFFFGLAFALGWLLFMSTVYQLNDWLLVHMTYIDNFLNSAFFLAMFFRRPGLEGQSLYIATFKMIGTAASYIASYNVPWPGTSGSFILVPIFIGIFALDLAYYVLVYQRARKLGINPFGRF